MVNLSMLPEDVLFAILKNITVRDVLACRQTCRTILNATKAKQLWVDILRTDVPREMKPMYWKHRDDLSSAQIEVLVLHALRLCDRFRVQDNDLPSAVSLHQSRPVTWIHIIQGTWLLVASSDSSTSILALWSLASVLRSSGRPDSPVELYLDGPVRDGRVEVQNGRAIIALEIHSPRLSIEIFTLAQTANGPVFAHRARHPGLSRIRCLHGRFVGFALYNEVSIPCVLDWTSGVVTELQSKPDREGGCVAMAICGEVIATLAPQKLHLFTLNTSGTGDAVKQIARIGLPISSFVDAALVIEDSTFHRSPNAMPRSAAFRLRLCLTFNRSISVYDLEFLDGNGVLAEIWRHEPSEAYEDFRYPAFGATSSHLSWFHWRMKTWNPVAFEASWIPIDADREHEQSIVTNTETLPVFPHSTFDGPAFYCAGTRAFDETRGILVLGSGFGELTMYDLVDTEPSSLQSCFNALNTDNLDVDISLTTWKASHAALPFSLSGSWDPVDQLDAIISEWQRHQPNPAPAGWKTDFRPLDTSSPVSSVPEWTQFVRTLDEGSGSEFEDIYHILGTPIPLMYHEREGVNVAQVGGLLVASIDGEIDKSVLEPGTTLEEIANAVREGNYAGLRRTVLTYETGFSYLVPRMEVMWKWEWTECGRNRWQELADRGGEVHASWLEKKPESELWWCS